MSIYKKLATIQCNLLNVNIKKSGHNRHKNFKYHELEDLIPPIFEECMKQELTLMFTFVDNAAILKLKDWNGKDEISVRITQPELVIPEKNPNNQLIQAVGANVTYLKRYLLINTFLITEKEVIDSDNVASSAEKVTFKETSEPKSNIDVPSLIKEAKEKLVKKGVEPTNKAIKNQVRTLKTYSVADRRAINEYFKREGL